MSDLTRVTTQFRLPDGSLIDVFVRHFGDGTYEVTDAGDTLGWIRSNSPDPIRTDEQNERIATALCADPDVTQWMQMIGRPIRAKPPLEIREGEIVAGANKHCLDTAITRVARAAAAVAAAGLPEGTPP